MKFTIISFLFCIIQLPIFAQQENPITGRIMSGIDSAIIPLATISIYNRDTALLAYTLSNEEGIFTFQNVLPPDRSYLLVTASGYEPYRQTISTVPQNNLQIYLQTLVVDLESITIVAERPPVLVKKDTIIYNASAFNMLPDALLNDLLKKLPGIDFVEGRIFVNGKQVNELLIDGREFFSGNMQIALQNLPANVVSQVEFYEKDKEFNSRSYTGYGTLNVKLKKAIKTGIFGKLYGGAGSGERYELGGLINVFRDTLQLSLLGYSNNVNKVGFGMGDILELGGYTRNLISKFTENDNALQLNGISLGGTNTGIQSSNGLGFNVNHTPLKGLDLALSYLTSNNIVRESIQSSMWQLLEVDEINSHTQRNITRDNKSHLLTFSTVYQKHAFAKQSLSVQLGFDRFLQDMVNNQRLLYEKSSRLPILSGVQASTNTRQMPWQVNYSLRSKSKSERSLLNTSIQFSKTFDEIFSAQLINYSHEDSSDRYLEENTRQFETSSLRNNFTFTRHLNHTTSLQIPLQVEYEVSNLHLNMDKLKYSKLDSMLITNSVLRKLLITEVTPTVVKELKGEWYLSLGLKHIHQQNVSNKGGDFSNYLSPSFDLSKNNFNVSYNERISIFPAIYNTSFRKLDDINTYQIGASSLKYPVYKTLNISWNKFDWKKGAYHNINVNGSLRKNAIVWANTITMEGVFYAQPLNILHSREIGISAIKTGKIKLLSTGKFSINYSASLNPLFAWGQAIFNDLRSDYFQFSWSPKFRLSSYISDKHNIEMAAQRMDSYTKYKDAAMHNLQYGFWRITSQYSFRSKLYQAEYFGTWDIIGANKWLGTRDNFLINISLSRYLLQNNQLQLKVSVYDLINKNRSLTATSYANQYYYNNAMVLQRYGMLSAIYNLNSLYRKRNEERNSLLHY